jgi:hypothetical protein
MIHRIAGSSPCRLPVGAQGNPPGPAGRSTLRERISVRPGLSRPRHRRGPGNALCQHLKAMQKHLDKIARTRGDGRACDRAAGPSRLAHDRQTQDPEKPDAPPHTAGEPPSPMPPRTSGNTCTRPVFRIAFSKTATRSSRPVAKHGAGSMPRPAVSDQSLPAAGRASVRINEGWYYSRRWKQ